MVRPTVTIVFLVYNRCEELRTSLRAMLDESDYPREHVDVIVVDNASTDGSAAMVRDQFPHVHLIERSVNCGVSGWNDGFAVARGDYVLALDDDCYLPPKGLRHAVEAAEKHDAQLVSFGVRSSEKSDHLFNQSYKTGLFTFWGCAALFKRDVLRELVGYDPEIFVWANELDFTLRFYDRGYTHLHLPEVVAVHMKQVNPDWRGWVKRPAYRVNARHFAYVAAKLFAPRDAVAALVALLTLHLRDGLKQHRVAFGAIPQVLKGFVHGLRHRAPLRNPRIGRIYRHNFFSYASPWWLSRPLPKMLSDSAAALAGRRNGTRPKGREDEYFDKRARYYPEGAATLRF